MTTVAQEIEEKRAVFVDAMFRATGPMNKGFSPEAEQRQYLTGFLSLLLALAKGDPQPRQDYLEAIVPNLRKSGVPFSFLLTNMIGVSMAIATVSSPENLAWFIEKCAEHTDLLVQHWEKP